MIRRQSGVLGAELIFVSMNKTTDWRIRGITKICQYGNVFFSTSQRGIPILSPLNGIKTALVLSLLVSMKKVYVLATCDCSNRSDVFIMKRAMSDVV